MKLYLYLNFECNCDCIFCASDETGRTKGKLRLTLAECQKFFSSNQGTTDSIFVNGGEPTIHPEIVDIVRSAASYYNQVHMATNGIQLSDARFTQELCAAGLTHVCIPLYGAEADVHDRIVRRAGSYRQTLTGVANLLELRKEFGIRVGLKLLLCRLTYQQNPRIVDLISERFPTIDHLSLTGVHLGSKALEHIDEVFVPFKEALPYTSETVRKSLKFNFSMSHVPLCAIEPDLVVPVLENLGATRIHNSQILLRPDDDPFLDPVTYHAEPQCLECDLFEACEKVYPKNSHLLNYSRDLTPMRISICNEVR